MAVLALDIGGTKIAAALVDGARVLAVESDSTPAMHGPEAVVAAAVALIRRLDTSSADLLGVACAGVVRDGLVTAMSTELMPGWVDFPLAERLHAELGLPVTVINDAQAAAFGEYAHGAGAGRQSLLFITVSTGVGGGLVLDGKLRIGHTGLAGHVGHIHGGALEQLTSGTALASRARESGHAADARSVLEVAAAGESWAASLLDDAVTALLAAIVDIKLLVDPEVIVLGGGVGLNPMFLDAVRFRLSELPDNLRLELVSASLGTNAGLVGAAAWAVGSRGRR